MFNESVSSVTKLCAGLKKKKHYAYVSQRTEVEVSIHAGEGSVGGTARVTAQWWAALQGSQDG